MELNPSESSSKKRSENKAKIPTHMRNNSLYKVMNPTGKSEGGGKSLDKPQSPSMKNSFRGNNYNSRRSGVDIRIIDEEMQLLQKINKSGVTQLARADSFKIEFRDSFFRNLNLPIHNNSSDKTKVEDKNYKRNSSSKSSTVSTF